jgi:Ca2+-transporting ATPase
VQDPARQASTALAWHQQDAPQVAQAWDVDPARGLARAAVAERQARYGPNEIEERPPRPLWRLLATQFADLMILVLMAAAVISGLIGELKDSAAILVIVLLNALVGAFQEYRAERAVRALRRMAAPSARVLRDGEQHQVPASDLVPGDVVALSAGDVVPADLRLFESADLKLDEAALTGESHTVSKQANALPEAQLPLGDRLCMAYKGTHVTSGRGSGIVVATAMDTELGRVASLLSKTEAARTPLQKRLARFGQRLALAVLAVCAVVFAAGLLRGEPWLLMFLTAVSLAVAAIPEALPAVVTVALALGARTMASHRTLIRRLPAVETLGSVTFICADKTGTLTENRMRVDAVVADGRREPQLPVMDGAAAPWDELSRAMALNNDAVADAEGRLQGEPTEVALLSGVLAAGADTGALAEALPRVAELPFDAERKRMSTLHQSDGGVAVYVKGAPEAILDHCDDALSAAGTVPLAREHLLAQAHTLADEGYRVLAFARRQMDAVPAQLEPETVENALTFLGLVGLIDPPREEVPDAVAECRSAGIVPVMITGDHPGTARAIARRLGIVDGDDAVLTGQELARLSPAELEERVGKVRVYARVSPEQKIRIVQALQQRGEFAAMTGDGVNDAPALKQAHIGVAMGQKGTDVAREAADMVLLDDNFATIVRAVREGRRIYDNIRKFVKYTMTSNSGEIWTLFLAPFLGLPIPLLPIQILWINLVTDGLPGLALAAEPEEPGLMRRPPRPPGESIFAHGMWQHIIWGGLLIGGLSIVSQAWAYYSGSAHWQTVVFTVLTFCQLVQALVIRSERESLFTIGLRSNLPLLGAVLLTVGLQLAVVYIPFFNPIFRTQPLSLVELGVCFVLPLVVLVAVEAEKWLVRRGLIYRQDALLQRDRRGV